MLGSAPSPATLVARWALTLAATAAVTFAIDRLGVASPALYGGLLVGLAVALRTRWLLDVPEAGMRGAQITLGVSVGLLVSPATLEGLADVAGPIALVLVLSVGASLVAGLLIGRWTGVDRPTAMFGMLAGGASGVVVMSRELGADERQVAVMQYLRVLLISASAPIVAGIVGSGGAATPTDVLGDSLAGGVLTVVACGALGVLLARLARLPVGVLLGPMLVAAGLMLAGAPGLAHVPELLLQPAYAAIGLMVGLRFTVESLRTAARILPAVLTTTAGLIAVSAGIGMLLVPLAGIPALDAYLATTPGGLYASLAAAAGTDVDTPLVLANQVLRLFAVLLLTPFLGRWVARRARSDVGATEPSGDVR